MSYFRFLGFGGRLVVDVRKLGRAKFPTCPPPHLIPPPPTWIQLTNFNFFFLIFFKFQQQCISFSRFTKRCHVDTQRNNGYCCGSWGRAGEKLWDIVIIFSAFVFTELFKILFYAIHEFKKFFIRESIIHRYLFCCLSYNFCFNYKCK